MSNVPLMNSARKTLPLLIATLAPFCGAAAHAAGLGELTAHSSLGEPLRAEVRLMRAPGEDIDASCVKAVTGGSDDIPWIHNARIRLAGDRLQITTREPVNHPIAMLGLRVACGFELRREFTLLLSPPTIRNADKGVNAGQTGYYHLLKEPPVPQLALITRMAEIAQKMLRESLDAYARRDVALAQRVLVEDEEEDRLKAKALTELISLIRTDPPRSEAFVELILLSKNMERIGDHATNIAEDVVYMVLGKDIPHQGAAGRKSSTSQF